MDRSPLTTIPRGIELLTKSDRISLVFRLTEHIQAAADGCPWDHTRLILETFGFQTHNRILEEDINSGSDDALVELAQHFGVPVSMPATAVLAAHISVPREASDPLFLFASHLTVKKVLVGDVSRALAVYGVDLFVAHDTITHDSAWEEETRSALDRADGGLVFVHNGLNDSPWCDQEIGWLQGRHVPVMALKFDATPYGFFAKYQAQQVPDGATAETIAEITVDRIASKPELAQGLTASLVSAMADSPHFATTDKIWKRLRDRTLEEPAVALRLLDALKFNTQVHWADAIPDGRRPYVQVVVDFLRRQPCIDAIAEKVDEYVAYRDEEDFLEKQLRMHAFYEERDANQATA